MKKILNTAAALIAALCLAAGALVLAACDDGNDNGNENTGITYETIRVNLADKNSAQLYTPSSELEEGYYEFKSSDPEVSFTLTDGNDIDITEGCNSIYVNYKHGDIYDIGTANDNTSFSVVFIKLDKAANSAESGLELASERVMAFNLAAGESVYLYNPYELDVAGTQSAGAPQMVTGSNFKATVDGADYTESFKAGSNKSIKITTADGSAGTVVLYIKAINNTHTIAAGDSENVEIGLLERSLRTQSNMNPSPALLWESNLRFMFTVEEKGTYKFTISNVNLASDLLSIDNIKSTGEIPVVPNINEFSDANPFEVTFVITEGNLGYATEYTIDFITAFKDYGSEGYEQGDKLAYTVTFEKIS